MKKAYTITIESGSKVGKAVIMAKSYKDAMSQALKACPAGFKVSKVQENAKEQMVRFVGSPRGPRCALAGAVDRGSLYKRTSKPAFWAGKKDKKFKSC
tara:strand:- start:36 stop:329 length:294 start_codon:yes stop_codon:yes gene_type:complete